MKNMLKREKGITMLTLVITVVLMLIITNILLYNAKNNLQTQRLTHLYNDLSMLREKVSAYYNEYGKIPAEIEYSNISGLSSVLSTKNDTGTFYVLDLEAMQGISLNYGKEYENVKNDKENANLYTDIYIINENSHNIFYVKGVTIKENNTTLTYYTDYIEPDETDIDLRYIDGILIPDGYYYIGKTTDDSGNESIVISNIKDEVIDTTKTNQYVWIKQETEIKEIPSDITLSSNQKDYDFIRSVNTYKGYFKNQEGNVLYIIVSEKTTLIADGGWNSKKQVNSPQLMQGMTGVYWDDNGNQVTVTVENQDNWYDYSNQKWANAVTEDGSYWVWIPRYAYQITSGLYTSTAGDIKVVFLEGRTNKNGETTYSTTYPTVANNAMSDYVVHPSFTDGSKTAEEIENGEIPFGNGEWDDEVPGFWVAKYAAGFQASTTDASDATTVINSNEEIEFSSKTYTSYYSSYTTNAIGQDLSSTNYSNQKISYPVFKPLTYAYNVISTGDSYTISQEIAKATSFYGLNSNKTDSHMMKNSEWGAVAYLAQSSYGRNGTEITINSKNLNNLNSKFIYAVTGYAGSTAKGVSASTTNNMSGVFDLSGCVWERTAGYITNGNENLGYGNSYVATTSANAEGYKTLSTKYATVYPYDSSSDNYENNWTVYNNLKSSTYGFGDSILETSTQGSGSNSWKADYSAFAYTSYPFFIRGGGYGNGSYAGSFAFHRSSGGPYYDAGFRAVLFGV